MITLGKPRQHQPFAERIRAQHRRGQRDVAQLGTGPPPAYWPGASAAGDDCTEAFAGAGVVEVILGIGELVKYHRNITAISP